MAFILSLLASSSQVHRKMYVCFSFRPAISDFEIVITALGPQSYKGLAEIGVKNFILDGRPRSQRVVPRALPSPLGGGTNFQPL